MGSEINELHIVVREFEATFKHVRLGRAARTFEHEDSEYTYFEICAGSSVPKPEGDKLQLFDTAEEAINGWREAVKPHQGRTYLYWRIVPEIDVDEDEFDTWSTGVKQPNTTYGKWKVYSRFRTLD